jgi:hypothetical protein
VPIMLQTEQFAVQMAELDAVERARVWGWLKRARDGLPTFGVEKPWAGDWELWPCGTYRVLLRPLSPAEVQRETGVPGAGIYLVRLELAE